MRAGYLRRISTRYLIFIVTIAFLNGACRLPPILQSYPDPPRILSVIPIGNVDSKLTFLNTTSDIIDMDLHRDGQRIAVSWIIAMLPSPPQEIYLIDRQALTFQQISQSSMQWELYYHPRWNPITDMLLYISQPPQPVFEFLTMGVVDLESGDTLGLANSNKAEWSADGNGVYALISTSIQYIPLSGEEPATIVSLPSRDIDFRIAPRSNRLAILVSETNEIWILDPATAEQPWILPGLQKHRFKIQTWSPDERWLVFSARDPVNIWSHSFMALNVNLNCWTKPLGIASIPEADPNDWFTGELTWSGTTNELALPGRYLGESGIYWLSTESRIVEEWLQCD